MIRKYVAPQWYRGNERGWERFHNIWPWAAGMLAGGLYYINPVPMDDAMRAGWAAMRGPLLRNISKLEAFDESPEVISLELPPDYMFGPLPLKQQMFFAIQALEEDNELGDGYITRMITDRFEFGLGNAFGENAFYEAGGEKLYDEAVRRWRDYDNQRVKFFNSDRFLRLMNIALESKEIAQKHVKSKDGVALLLKAAKEGTDPYSPHLCSRALALLAIHQGKDGTVERSIFKNPGGVELLCDLYTRASGDPLETRYYTLLLSSILRVVPQASKQFVECGGIAAVFAGMNKTMFKALPQHLRVFRDIQKREPKAVERYLKESDAPMAILIGVIKNCSSYFEMQGHLFTILQACMQARGPFELVEYGGVDLIAKSMAAWPREIAGTAGLHERWEAMYRSILTDPTCVKYAKESKEVKNELAKVQAYFAAQQSAAQTS